MRPTGVCAVVLCLLTPHFLLADSALDFIIKKVENHYNRARTLSANFTENFSAQGQPQRSESGTLTLCKQGKMRWDYAVPAGKIFVSDGKTIFLYTPSENRVEKIPLKDTEDMRAPLAFLLGHLDLNKEFRDFSMRPAGSEVWLDARAKNDKSGYAQIQMLVSNDGQITKLNLVNRDETKLDFAFSDERVNPAVENSLFDFKVPPGAEVVDAVEFAGGDR